MNELIIKNKYISVEKVEDCAESEKVLRVYKYSPDRAMIQIRAFTSLTRKSKPAAYIASCTASVEDIDNIIAYLHEVKAQIKVGIK